MGKFVEEVRSSGRVSDYGSEDRGFESRLRRDRTSCLSQSTQWARVLFNLLTQEAVIESVIAKLEELVHHRS